MARILNVYLSDHFVGELEQDDSGSLWFTYHADWLSFEGATPLSASLVLRSERFKRNECRPFFAGLLPEEESRKLVAKTFGVSDRNDFAILSKIGGECAGAVSLVEQGVSRNASGKRYEKISEDELGAKLQKLPLRPLLAGEKGIRLSLAGAQGKLAVMILEGEYFLSLDGAPSSHILKPDSEHYLGLARNEFFCMKLAREMNLDVAPVELHQAGEVEFLQVSRYDRDQDLKGHLIRVHQEDFCQALGIVPELKYQQEGGPDFKQCFELIRQISSLPGPDVLALFDATIFNFLIGNNDAHGKNFSFLYRDGSTRLAPLYDLVCTQLYPELSNEMAMKIGGEKRPDQLRGKNWRKFFEEVGLTASAATKRALAFSNKAEQTLAEMDIPEATDSRLPNLVKANISKLRRALS